MILAKTAQLDNKNSNNNPDNNHYIISYCQYETSVTLTLYLHLLKT